MNTEHEFLIRVITEDGELVLEDRDFNVNDRFERFETVSNQNTTGEVTQLIDTESDYVVCEENWEY